jgi:hypothetical protein
MVRVVLQSSPQLTHRGVDARLDVDERVLPPQPIDDLAAGHDLARARDEHDQKVHRNPLQLDSVGTAPQLVAADVEVKVAESECSSSH